MYVEELPIKREGETERKYWKNVQPHDRHTHLLAGNDFIVYIVCVYVCVSVLSCACAVVSLAVDGCSFL